MKPPAVTMIMTAYEHAAFIGDAVRAALAQDYDGPLQVIISDDHSSDGTFEAMIEAATDYDGPFDVAIQQMDKNVGPNAHNAVLLSQATGQLIVRCHGDDVSEPQRVRRVVETWLETGATLISSNATLIDAQGEALGPYMRPSESRFITTGEIIESGWLKPMLGASYSWDRSLFEIFGPLLPEEVPRGGDHVLPFRAGLAGGFYFLDEPLVRYRQHPGQQTMGIADRTQDDTVFHETIAAFNLTTRMAMLRTLIQLEALGMADQRSRAAQGDLIKHLLDEVDAWIRERNELLLSGRVPTWVDRATLASKEQGFTFEPEHE